MNTLIKLRNDFHGTSVQLLVQPIRQVAYLNDYQWDKCQQRLCGAADCCCGIVRGPQQLPPGIDVVLGPLPTGAGAQRDIVCKRD